MNGIELYKQLKAVPVEKWETLTEKEVEALIGDAKIDASIDNTTTSFRLLGRVAHEYDQDTFIELVETGELPPMKLNSDEMEVIRGGILPAVIVGAKVASWAIGAAFGAGVAVGVAGELLE